MSSADTTMLNSALLGFSSSCDLLLHAIAIYMTLAGQLSDDPQARADRLDILLRDERLARRRAEEELERLRAQPTLESAKKSKGRVNFTARPWLFRYKSQNLEAIEEEDGILSQPSCGGESRQGVAGAVLGVALPPYCTAICVCKSR